MRSTHPLSAPTHPRVDLCHGGSQEATMKDSLALARHAVRELDAGEHVLIINSLCSSELLEKTARQISSHQAAGVITFS
ncbi:MAG TPA: hypothetical protein VFH43_07475, partial [Candidatus Kapabacteria bacterium]|nr:hypothetical protein [Candidatus Kapabacteria bacterium]